MRTVKTSFIAFMLVLSAAFPGPAPAQTQSPTVGLAAQTDTGTRPYIPYDGAAENINLTNGNLNLKVPLIHLPGRNGFDLDLNLEYDSKVWKLGGGYDAEMGLLLGGWEEDVRWPYVARGWHLNIPMINYSSAMLYDAIGYQYGCVGTTTVILMDGSRHNFSNNPGCGAPYEINVMDSEDNSGAILTLGTPDGTMLALRNGVKIYFPTTITGVASKMVDANGNFITINTTQNGSVLSSITDTLGRTILFNNGSGYSWNSQIPGSGLTSITYPDSDAPGGTFTVSLGYTSTTLNWYHNLPYTNWKHQPPVFISGRTGSSTRSMLTSVSVGGHVFSFEYLSDGELTKINYPSGGYTTYTYSVPVHNELKITIYPPAPPYYYSLDADFSEVAQKQSCTSPSDCATTTYNSGWLQANNSSMTVTFPDGHTEVHSFTQGMIAGQAGETNHGLAAQEIQVVTKSPSDVTLQTVTTTYSGTKAWDLPTSVQTQLDASGPAKLQTLTYDTFSATYLPWLDPWVEAQPTPTTVTRKIDNVTQRLDYDWGQTTLLRKTVTSYVHTLNGHDYFSSGIRLMNLPATSTVYDGAGAQKAQTQYVYDGAALTSTSGAPSHDYTNYSSSYVTRGNATQVQRWRNLPSSTWLTTYNTYDDLGNLRSSTDPGGHATAYAYDDSWSGSSCLPVSNSWAYLTQVTNALGQHVQASYFPCIGRMQSRTDENSALTTYTYDQFSRMLSRVASDGGQVTNAFNDTPPVTVTSTSKITPSLNMVSIAQVDGLGRLKQTQFTSDPEGTVSTDTTYDGLNRAATASNPYRSTGEATYGVTTTNYDGLSRVTQVIPPDGSSSANNVSTAYSGNCSTVTDQAGKTRKSCVDGLGRLTQVFEPNASGSFIYETDYQYDPLNNLTRVDQKGNDSNSANWRTRTFTYDSLSRLLTASNPESGTITYTYDNDGNLLTKADARPITITYSYDALHRLTGKTYSNGDPAVSYFYDQTSYNGLTIANGIGRRTGMTDASATPTTAAWSYDSMGRALTERRIINGTSAITKNIVYTYNLDGSMASLAYPSGRTVTYAPGGASRALSAIDPANSINYATNALYAPQGALASLKNGVSGGFTGIVTSNSYNKRLQPVILSAASPSQTVLSLSYDFHVNTSNNGNVFQIQNNRDTTRSVNYDYDELSRIKSAATASTSGPNCWGQLFGHMNGGTYVSGFDPWANLKEITVSQCSAPTLSLIVDGSNHVTGSGYSYDAAGNMTSDGLGHSPVYDAENRIKTVAGVTYTYDGDGKRVKKDSGKLYWTGTGSDPLDESDLSGTISEEYVYFNGKRIARVDLPSGTVHYYFSDHLGSASVVTNATGATIEQESDYYPFGGERVLTSGPNQYKFTGKERDSETGLDYFGARYYASSTGRWMVPDWAAKPTAVPYADFGDPQTLNLYGYVRNNPLEQGDADGHCGPLCFGGIGAAAGSAIYGGTTLYHQWKDNGKSLKNVNWKEVGKETLKGAAVGFVVGASLGAAYKGADVRVDPAKPDPTTDRPKGVPDDWEKRETRGKDGTQYVNPENEHDRVRVMPGDPSSSQPGQQQPYVVRQKDGSFYDKNGNEVGHKSQESHIPLKDYEHKDVGRPKND